MLTLVLPAEIVDRITAALRAAGRREVGGILMAEHVGPNTFRVRDITVHRRGAIASFVRRIGEAMPGLRAFFKATGHDYRRFNYLGEWHSHPLFVPLPSQIDDQSMYDLVTDPAVGAQFATLLIVKLDEGDQLVASAHTYLADGDKSRSVIRIEAAP